VQEALLLCQQHGYGLIIPKISQYHAHLLLSQLLKEAFSAQTQISDLILLDHPYANKNNIHLIIDELQKRRQNHGALIKEGLSRSNAKSGNPKAAEIIHRVNRPKILFSILFSLVIDPIVSLMEEQKLAQRKMVDYLNTHNFHAPEGGRWVLSQFQKVYERVRLNRIALAVHNKIDGATVTSELIQELNLVASHFLPKNVCWSEELVLEAQQRLHDLTELEHILKGKKELEQLISAEVLNEISVDELLEDNKLSVILNAFKDNNTADLKSA
jgi:hypothetical protein